MSSLHKFNTHEALILVTFESLNYISIKSDNMHCSYESYQQSHHCL